MTDRPARSLYFVNGPVDFGIIGGLTIILFVTLKLAAVEGRPMEGAWLAAWLSWVVNWPHFSATNYRLYHTRANIAQYPFTALGVPILLTAGILASYAWPLTVAPAFVKLFLIWSPYHFSGQSLGISLLYAKRAGVSFGRLERAALAGFLYATCISSVLGSEDTTRPRSFHGILVPRLGIPVWVADASVAVMYLLGIFFLILCTVSCILRRRRVPLIVFLPALTQFLWFGPGRDLPSFNEFVPFLHSLQYLLIAWSLQLKERADLSAAPPSRAFVFRQSVHWGLINFWGGVALFWVLPRLGQAFGHPLQFSEPVLIAAVQIHHFFVDGVIWKLRHPQVSSPLLVSLGDLIRPASQPVRVSS